MSEFVGVDGCAEGWIFVVEAGGLDVGVVPHLESLLERVTDSAIVAIDVPIGLTNADRESVTSRRDVCSAHLVRAAYFRHLFGGAWAPERMRKRAKLTTEQTGGACS